VAFVEDSAGLSCFQVGTQICHTCYEWRALPILHPADSWKQLRPENLFRTVNSVLNYSSQVSFPDHLPSNDLADKFGNYYVRNIDDISLCLKDQKSTLPTYDQHAIQEDFVGEPLASFKPLFQHQVALIIPNAPKKSCLLDPLPTSVLVKVWDVLLPVQ